MALAVFKCTVALLHMLAMLQPGQSAPEMAAAAAAAAVVREAAANAVMDVLDAGESEEEKTTKLAMAKEDKMRKVIRSGHIACAVLPYALTCLQNLTVHVLCEDQERGKHAASACRVIAQAAVRLFYAKSSWYSPHLTLLFSMLKWRKILIQSSIIAFQEHRTSRSRTRISCICCVPSSILHERTIRRPVWE